MTCRHCGLTIEYKPNPVTGQPSWRDQHGNICPADGYPHTPDRSREEGGEA